MKRAIIIGILCFIVGMIVFFPYHTIRDMLVQRASDMTGVEIYVEGMRPVWAGPGVRIKNVTLQYVIGHTWRSHIEVEIAQLTVYVPWMSLLTLDPRVEFSAKVLPNGVISGIVRFKQGRAHADLSARNFEIVPYFRQIGFTDVKADGRLSVMVRTAVDPQRGTLGETRAELAIQDLMVGELDIAGFQLPELAFGSPTKAMITSQDGRKFDVRFNMGGEGDPVTIESTGELTLDARRMNRSTFQFKNTIVFSSDFAQAPTVELMLPLLSQFQKPDGRFNIQFNGDFSRGVTQFPTTF